MQRPEGQVSVEAGSRKVLLELKTEGEPTRIADGSPSFGVI